MSGPSLPLQRPVADFVSAPVRSKYEDHLNDCILAIRDTPCFSAAHELCARSREVLRQSRAAGDPTFLENYFQAVVSMTGPYSIHDQTGSIRRAAPLDESFYHLCDEILEQADLLQDGASRTDDWNYRLLLAHLLLSPDDVEKAGQIPEPFPWPLWFEAAERAGRLAGRIHVVPGVQIRDPLRQVHNVIQSRLDAPLRHGDARRGSSPAAIRSRKRLNRRRLAAGKVAYELSLLGLGLGPIAGEPRFQEAARLARLTNKDRRVVTDSVVSRLMTLWRVHEGLPPRRRGRPPKK